MAATLVLAAWEPEIAPLRRLARAVAPERLVLGTVGVGAVDAAVGAAAAIAAARPDRVIFVGTAGAYPRGRATAAIGTVAVASELCLVSTAALRGDGYLPEPLATRAAPAASLGAALENLEAFSVARAAAAAGVDAVAAVLGIANRVGPRGHQEWRAHHAAASRAACRLVWSLIRA